MSKYLYIACAVLVVIVGYRMLVSGNFSLWPRSWAASEVQEITMDEAVELWQQKKVLVVDVRTEEEYRQGHVPGAVSLPLPLLAERNGEIPHDKTVLLICRSGNRSAKANLLLQKAGFTNTVSVKGGMLDWVEETEP